MGGKSSGAGSSSATPPVNTPDNLRSNDKMEVILALCHGPIRGLVNGDKSFFVGEVPFQANDNSYNFLNAGLTIYPGQNPGETIRPQFGGFEDFRGVWQSLTPGQYIEFPTQSPDATTIILRLGVKRLWRRATTLVLDQYPGDGFAPATANLTIEYYRFDTLTWVNPFGSEGYSFVGKALERDVHEVRIPVPSTGTNFLVRVRQNTPSSEEAPCEIEVEGFYDVSQGFYGLTTSQNVGVQLEQNVPVVRTTREPPRRRDGSVGIDMIDIRILVNQLVYQKQPAGGDPGGTFNEELLLNIEHKLETSSTWLNHFNGPVRIYGKVTTDQVVFEYRIPVTASPDRYDVRITRISGEDSERFRNCAWESMQEIVAGPARFDGVAVAQFTARASNQFSSLPPLRGVYDLKMVKVPTNYDPTARTYTGTWDGTFKIAWTDNPAWCLYDLAMDDTYGARKFWPELNLDRYSVYEAAQWCDELVPDGAGGFQPRYTMNTLITEGRGVKDQLRYMAGSFNGVLVDELNGNVRLVVDKDDDAVAVFAPENVIDGQFDYSFTDIQTRYNEITVRFKNKNLNYENDARKLIDADHQALYGVIPFEFAAVGCTDAHEAIRRAAYRLITSTTEVESIAFRVNRRGLLLRPFDVILVADPDMGRSLSGRIKSLDQARTTVSLRDPIYLETGVTYKLWLDVPDDSKPGGVVTVERTLSGTYNGYVTSFALTQALPSNTPELATFSLGTAASMAGAPKAYRVMKIDNEEGDTDSITIEAIEINRNKWLYADTADEVGGIVVSQISGEIAPPVSVTVTALSREINGELKPYVLVTWEPSRDPRVNQYRVQYRVRGDETWIDGALTRTNRVELYELGEGIYDIRVGSVFGTQIAWFEKGGVPTGTDIPPSNVAALTLTMTGEVFYLSWTAVPDTDLSHYEIRHTAEIGPTATWETATVLVEKAVGTSVVIPGLSGTYFIKAVDIDGLKSASARSTSLSDPAAPTGLVVLPTSTVNGDGSVTLAMEIKWSAVTHPFISAYEINYRKTGATEWEAVTVPSSSTRYILSPVITDQGYQIRVRVLAGLVQGPWSVILNATGARDNVAPSAPTNLTAQGFPVGIALQWTMPSDLDLAAIEIYESLLQAGPYLFLAETSASGYRRDILGGETRWYRIRARDRSGNVSPYAGPVQATSLFISATDFVSNIKPIALPADNTQLAVFKTPDQFLVPQQNMTDPVTGQALIKGRLYRWSGTQWAEVVTAPELTGSLTDSQIASLSAAKLTGTIQSPQFPLNLRPVEVVSSLPTTGNFEGRTVYLSTDDKLYRYTGTAWTASVPATDISGTLADAQIAAVAASKVTGQLADSQIAGVGAAKLTGQITTTQITDNAISTAKISAGAVSTAKLAAGAVTADTIASNAVTAAKISAGAIETAKIASGAISADKIAANAVTAEKIAANSVTAAKLDANSVTADKIQAGAVQAAAIAANAITASKLFVSDPTNLWIDYDLEDAAQFTSTGTYSFGTIASDQVGRRYLEIASQGLATSVFSDWFSVEPNSPYAVLGAAWMSGTGSISSALQLEFGSVDASGVVTPALAESTNRVVNGNFAATPAAADWGVWTNGAFTASLPSGFSVLSGSGYNGSPNHLRVTTGATSATVASNSNRIAVSAGQLYFLQASVQRVSTPSRGLVVRLRFFDAANQEVASSNNSLTWTSASSTSYSTQSVISSAILVPEAARWAQVEITTNSSSSLTGGYYRVGEVYLVKRRLCVQEATTTTSVTRQTVNVTSPLTAQRARFIALRSSGLGALARSGGFIVRRRMSGELVVDGAITTTKIAAGAVEAANIAAGAITTEKLSVGSASGNLLYNSCMAYNRSGWTTGGSHPPTAWGVVGQDVASSDWRLVGAGTGGAMRTGTMPSTSTSDVWWTHYNGGRVPVAPGEWYEFQALVQAHRCSIELKVGFYDANNNYFGEVLVASNGPTSFSNGRVASNYVLKWGKVEVPANAATAMPFFRMIGENGFNSPTGTDPYIFFTRCLFARGNANQTEPTPWGPGGVTEIEGSMIRAASIQTDQIAANAITANKLAATELITSSAQLGAAVITTAKIGELQVDTLRLANNSVTAVAFGEWSGSSSSISINVGNGDGNFGANYLIQGYVEGNSGFNTYSTGEGFDTSVSPLSIGLFRNFNLISSYTVVSNGPSMVSGAFPITRTEALGPGFYTWSIAASGNPLGTQPVYVRRLILLVTKILK